MSRTDELKLRVEARKKELEADLLRARAAAQGAKSDAVDALERKLKSLGETIGSSWDSLTEATAKKLSDWLK
jgi:hypothetical protein